MNRLKSFNVTNAVRFDMHVNGGRFIIWEFIIASIIVAGVVVISAIHYASSKLSIFGGFWIFSFLGILFNCLTIAILAINISRNEGNRPEVNEKVNAKLLAVLFTLYILTPYVLFFTACRQAKKN